MPITNFSENKVRVVKYHGVSHPLGLIDPIVGMPVKHGIDNLYIASLDSGNYQVGLSLAYPGTVIRKAYPHDCAVTQAVATGTYSFPTGDASYAYGHHAGIMANGIPYAIGSGAAYQGGDGSPHTFSMGGL